MRFDPQWPLRTRDGGGGWVCFRTMDAWWVEVEWVSHLLTLKTILVMSDSNLPPQHLFWWRIPTAYHEEPHQCSENGSTQESQYVYEVGSPDWNHILGVIVVLIFRIWTLKCFVHDFFRRDRYEKVTLYWAETCVRAGRKHLGCNDRNPMIVELKFAVHHLPTTNPFALLILNKT